jgi:hypothetical protein
MFAESIKIPEKKKTDKARKEFFEEKKALRRDPKGQ